MNLQAAIEALQADPELHGPMREMVLEEKRHRIAGLSLEEKRLLHVLDAMEVIDPQTEQGKARLAEAEVAQAQAEARRQAQAVADAVHATGHRMHARVNAHRQRVNDRERRLNAASDATTGTWGDNWRETA